MRDFDSIKNRKMKDIENHLRHIYNKGYDDGLKDGVDDGAYERGLQDAWELAKKISKQSNAGGFYSYQLKNIFGTFVTPAILSENTASEAMAKVKAFEAKQKATEDDFSIGNVVHASGFSKPVVIIATGTDEVKVMNFLGDVAWVKIDKIIKTNMHFPEIADVLRKMQEGEG